MPRSIALASMLLAACVVAMIVLWGRLHQSALHDPQTMATGIPPLAMRKPAPDITATTLTGSRLSLADFRGKPLVVTFFASWCPPCKTDAPRIAALASRYGSRIRILGIDGGDTRTGVHRFLHRYGWRFPIVWDPDNTQYAAFRVPGQPATFVIDSRGMLVERFLGPLDPAVARHVIGRLLTT